MNTDLTCFKIGYCSSLSSSSKAKQIACCTVTPSASVVTTQFGSLSIAVATRGIFGAKQAVSTFRAQMQAARTRAARSAPLKPWQAGLAWPWPQQPGHGPHNPDIHIHIHSGVRRVRACRMEPLPSGGGRRTRRILSSLPGLQHQPCVVICKCRKQPRKQQFDDVLLLTTHSSDAWSSTVREQR